MKEQTSINILKEKNGNVYSRECKDSNSSMSTDLNDQSTYKCSKILEFLVENEKVTPEIFTNDLENKSPESPLLNGFWGCMKPVMKYFTKACPVEKSDSSTLNSSWIIPFESITDLKFLGSGSQGAVFSGMYQGEKIAIKKLNKGSYRDIKYLRELNHRNIIQFKGACIEKPCFSLLMEYCPFGQLYQILHSGEKINPAQICSWTSQIIDGMSYLHSKDIIHRDLKSPNILIGSDHVIKISDLCTSTKWTHQPAQMSFAGTVAWMAPEIIRNEPCSFKVDVWSFGVVLWELMTNKVPYENVDSTSVIWGVGSENLCLPLPMSFPTEIRVIIKRCWDEDPNRRPSFNEIRSHFNLASYEFQRDVEEDEFYLIKENWNNEICLHFDYMRKEGVSLPKLEAYLIKLRRNELKHAQDIRKHYDYKLSRVNQLYDELQEVIDKIDEEKQNLHSPGKGMKILNPKTASTNSKIVRCGTCGTLSMLDLSDVRHVQMRNMKKSRREPSIDPDQDRLECRKSIVKTIQELLSINTEKNEMDKGKSNKNEYFDRPVIHQLSDSVSFSNPSGKKRQGISNHIPQRDRVNKSTKIDLTKTDSMTDASQNSLFTEGIYESQGTIITKPAIVQADSSESEDDTSTILLRERGRAEGDSVINGFDKKSNLSGQSEMFEPKLSNNPPSLSQIYNNDQKDVQKRIQTKEAYEQMELSDTQTYSSDNETSTSSKQATQESLEKMTKFESKMPLYPSIENLAKDLAAHMSDSFSEKESLINKYMFRLRRPPIDNRNLVMYNDSFANTSHVNSDVIPYISKRMSLNHESNPYYSDLYRHEEIERDSTLDQESVTDFLCGTNQSGIFSSLTEVNTELVCDKGKKTDFTSSNQSIYPVRRLKTQCSKGNATDTLRRKCQSTTDIDKSIELRSEFNHKFPVEGSMTSQRRSRIDYTRQCAYRFHSQSNQKTRIYQTIVETPS